MVLLKETLALARTTRNAFNYWHRAGLLKTAFSETSPGVARALTRDNVLEIAFMSALTDIGLSPKAATPLVASWLLRDRRGELLDFIAIRRDEFFSIEFNDLRMDDLAYQLGAMRRNRSGEATEPDPDAHAISFSVVNRREIIRRVEALLVGVS